MARRLKMTPFARFLLFMLFLVPAAYIGAAYYNGENGIEKFKNLIGLDRDSAERPAETTTIEEAPAETLELQEKIKALEEENRRLREQLEEAESKVRAQEVQ